GGGVQDVLRRAVVLLQSDDSRFRKIVFELENITDIGATPGIDGLVFIANGTNVVTCAGEQAHELILRAIRVLVFVHQNVLETPVVIFAYAWHGLQQAHSFQKQIVEVESVSLGEFFFVFGIDLGDALGLGVIGLKIDFLRIEHVVLGPGNVSENRARSDLLVVNAETAHDGLNQLLLVGFVVDNKLLAKADGRSAGRGWNPKRFDIAAEDAHTKRMES